MFAFEFTMYSDELFVAPRGESCVSCAAHSNDLIGGAPDGTNTLASAGCVRFHTTAL